MQRITIDNRADWLERRNLQGIGASESAAVCGLSPFMTASELYQLKTGMAKPKDLSDNDAVSRGVRMEPALRELFAANHPEWEVEHHPYDILFSEDRPFMFATLDGEITDENGRKGVLEIKTASPTGKASWDHWKEQIPDYYYTQVLHQLSATGYGFSRLFACLISADNTMTIREYEFERADLEDDIRWLEEKETEFWESVKRKELPPLTLVV